MARFDGGSTRSHLTPTLEALSKVVVSSGKVGLSATGEDLEPRADAHVSECWRCRQCLQASQEAPP